VTGIRIVAGSLKGRRIPVPPGGLVRPTADRAREALFSILGPRVPGARVLDAFAGTGALGLEAASRGAREVRFVESDRDVAGALVRTLARLDVGGPGSVVVGDAVGVLGRAILDRPFDLVLADPPYRAGLAERFLAALAAGAWVAVDGLAVIERGRNEPAFERPGPGLALVRSAGYGSTRFDLYSPP